MITCSLIISTYNWPEALSVCLMSVNRQTKLPTEIIICDDGSKEETASVVNKFRLESKIPVLHVWQPDDGFQLARIRNKGFAASKAEYCIQIDGDLILHPRFIEDHISFARKGYFTTGSRVLLTPSATQAVLSFKNNQYLIHKLSNKNQFNGLHIPLLKIIFSFFYKRSGANKYYVKGCNMAFWKSDILMVNGYNENFTGWGREDSELAIRLMNAGVKKRFLKFGGICYHLHHKEASRDKELVNSQLMNDAILNKITYCSAGINRYMNDKLT